MALVKVVTNNLFSGANLRKLEVGEEIEVDNSTAERWASAGLVIILEDRAFEVATPGGDHAEQPDTSGKKKGK